jgi:uncharacterized protein YndB with AHSA1/START domain
MLVPIHDKPFILGGTYKEIVSGEKLVYTWEWENLGHEVLATIKSGVLLLRRDQGGCGSVAGHPALPVVALTPS